MSSEICLSLNLLISKFYAKMFNNMPQSCQELRSPIQVTEAQFIQHYYGIPSNSTANDTVYTSPVSKQ